MPALSAPGDTWGISGPDFLNVYLGALAVFVVVAILIRLSVTRSGGTQQTQVPTPSEAATLAGGPSRAVYASLAALRTSQAVGTGTKGVLNVAGPPPSDAGPLDLAVYDAAQRRVAVSRLAHEPRVQSALADIGVRVAHAGWLLDPSARGRARLGGILLVALAGFGAFRAVSGIANDRPVGYLVMLCIITLLLSIYFFAVPRVSRLGRKVLDHARNRHAHLAPRQSPSWSTYGVAGAAMGVALFGTAAFWAADPAFAAEAGLRRAGTGDASGSSWGGGGGGDGGGGGCGGGGCGGGGCGG
jgi:uncharacterized protein (TIGR04222 family)